MTAANTVRADGFVEMAYVGETPWHGNGQRLTEHASIEQWTVAAGMDWQIKRAKVRFATAHGQDSSAYREVPGQVVLHRSDNKDALGIVSDKYKVVQPREVMEFFRDLTDVAGFTMETAGTLFGGRRFWALAHIGASAVIKNAADMVGGYLLLSTSADGSLATTGRMTTIRVVCNNTLSMALSGKAKHEVKLSHRSKFNAEQMKDQLGIERDGFTAWANTMRLLANESCGIDEAERHVFTLLTDEDWNKATAEQVADARDTRGFKTIMALFNGAGKGATMDGVRGTRWGLLNATTEYYDYHIKARSNENRLSSAWFGAGDASKTKMLELLTA
jgi:phage/plasmid-like protein (TIGR03299 family)